MVLKSIWLVVILMSLFTLVCGSWEDIAKRKNSDFDCYNSIEMRQKICPVIKDIKYLYHTTKTIEWLFGNFCPISAYRMSIMTGRKITHPGSKRDIQRGGGFFFYWRLLTKKINGKLTSTITMRGRYMLVIKKEALYQRGSFIQGVDAMGCLPIQIKSQTCGNYEKFLFDRDGGMNDDDFCDSLDGVFNSPTDHDEGGFFGGLNPDLIEMIICDDSYTPKGGCMKEKEYDKLVEKAKQSFIGKYKDTNKGSEPKFLRYFNVRYVVSDRSEMIKGMNILFNTAEVLVKQAEEDKDDLGSINPQSQSSALQLKKQLAPQFQ